MSYQRRSFSAIAVETTLDGTINNSVEAFSVADGTGWPTGSSGDFFAQIDDEVIRCESRTGTAVSVKAGGRGADGTSATTHTSGAPALFVITAFDADEANYVVAETVGKITTSQDLLVADGANSLARLGITNNRALIVTSNLVSWGLITSAMIATDAVTSAAIAADAVGSSEIAANAVGVSELSTAVAGDGLSGGGGSALAVNTDATTIETNADALRIKDLGVATGKIAANAVTQAKVASGFRLAAAGSSHPGTPAEGDLDFDTSNNLLYVFDGTNWVCITPKTAEVLTSEATSSATYTDLATGGPAVTVVTGTKALVTICAASANNTNNDGSLASVAVSGATTVAASDSSAIFNYDNANLYSSSSHTRLLTGLTPGSNVFTMKYRRDVGGTATFHTRSISVVGVP